MGKGVKRGKRRGRKSGLAVVPAARLRSFCFQTTNAAVFCITEAKFNRKLTNFSSFHRHNLCKTRHLDTAREARRLYIIKVARYTLFAEKIICGKNSEYVYL